MTKLQENNDIFLTEPHISLKILIHWVWLYLKNSWFKLNKSTFELGSLNIIFLVTMIPKKIKLRNTLLLEEKKTAFFYDKFKAFWVIENNSCSMTKGT